MDDAASDVAILVDVVVAGSAVVGHLFGAVLWSVQVRFSLHLKSPGVGTLRRHILVAPGGHPTSQFSPQFFFAHTSLATVEDVAVVVMAVMVDVVAATELVAETITISST